MGRKHWARNCGIPAKKLVQLKDWADAGWVYIMGECCLTKEHFTATISIALEESLEFEKLYLICFKMLSKLLPVKCVAYCAGEALSKCRKRNA